MSGNCLVGCVGQNQCTGGSDGGTLYPFAVAAPFVEITFGAGNSTLTVGNQSSPDTDNNACISGFNLANSSGSLAKIEVVDQEGGEFYNFFDSLIKCIKSLDEGHCIIDYGWIGTDCSGNPQKKTVSTVSGTKTDLLITEMNVTKNSGLYNYEIIAQDLGTISQAGKTQKTYGNDGKSKVPLKEAITNYCTDQEQPPVFKEVHFWRKKKGGGTEDWDFKALHDPPKGAWRANNQNKIVTILEWIQDYKTDKDKGVYITADDTANNLILWEDPLQECEDNAPCLGQRIGNFIVNGGNCSNVLDFNPTMNWINAWSNKTIGGEQGGPTSSAGVVHKGDLPNKPNPCDQGKLKQEGKVGNILINSGTTQNMGEQAIKKSEEAIHSNQLANSKWELGTAIDAELKILGTVEYGYNHIYENQASFVSITVINPFYLSQSGSGDCPQWLAQPSCNQVLTNTNWQVKTFSQDIRGGKFETTLSLTLSAGPGIDLPLSGELGGSGTSVSC